MRQVILIPLDKLDESNMYESIFNGGIKLGELESLLFVKLYDLLDVLYGKRDIPIWGVPSGNKSSEANKWNKINENDVAIFVREGIFVATAVTKMKFQSENIARRLWPNQTGLDSRQYLFTLDEFSELDVTKRESLGLIVRKRKLPLSEFQVLNNQLATDFLAELGLLEPKSLESGVRFGSRLSAAENKIIEKYSVSIAIDYLSSLGFTEIHDVGDTESFDLLATSDSRTLSVEVKGTTGPAKSVILTKNEVKYQKEAYPENALLIVYNIVLDDDDPKFASNGEIRFISPWFIEDSSLTAISYDYKV